MLTFIVSIACQQLLYFDYPYKKSFSDDILTSKQESSFDSSDSSPIRSITHGHINTSQQNLNNVLHKELTDVSATLSNKVEQAIDNVSQNTPHNFKEVIIIKKRILSDGKRKVVDLNVREKLIPKNESGVVEFKTRAIVAGVLALIAGLLITSVAKIYHSYIKNRYLLRNDNKMKIDTKY